jgi:hypothetical protein
MISALVKAIGTIKDDPAVLAEILPPIMGIGCRLPALAFKAFGIAWANIFLAVHDGR